MLVSRLSQVLNLSEALFAIHCVHSPSSSAQRGINFPPNGQKMSFQEAHPGARGAARS